MLVIVIVFDMQLAKDRAAHDVIRDSYLSVASLNPDRHSQPRRHHGKNISGFILLNETEI